ncbi:MAG: RNA polymerase sigma factor [Myxococcota bacterium]
MGTSQPETPENVVALFAGSRGLEARPDDELMLLARGGRRDAFDVLVRRHQLAALKLASKYLGEVAAARDACQNAFLELYRGLPRYRAQGRFDFFLRRVVLNQCRMLGRGARIGERALSSAPLLTTGDGTPAPDDALLAAERRRDVDRALGQLSDKLREVVVLRYTGGHSLEEIAAILELPLGTVKSRLFAAMEKLKGHLEGGAP